MILAEAPLTAGDMGFWGGPCGPCYRHADWLGTSRLVSMTNRTVYYDGAYAPFGQAYAQSGTTDLNFTGMDQHIVSGLYDFPAREYNGLEGRWPSPDPAGLAAVNPADPQTWNRYAYVRNNPLGLSDRTGMYIGGPRCAAMSGKRIPRAAEMCGGCYDNSDWNCIAGGSEGLSAPGDMIHHL